MMFADPRQENVIFLDANKLKNLKDNRDAEAVVCNLPTGEVSGFSVKAYQNSYGENEKELYFIEKQDAQNNIAAIVFSNGMPQKLTTVARTDFPAGFFENKIYIQSWQADFSWFTMKSLSEKSLVTYYTDSGKTDIVPRAVVEKYSLESKGTDSADSRYSLYNGEYHGGGDASYWKVWLMENATGRMKYIDEIGGMYGGGESAGFLQNNDVYVYSYDNFKIFDTNMNNTAPVWQMTDYLPVGENPAPGVQYRYLMAARRDPISKSVLALYFDMPHYDGENYKDIYLDIEKDSWQLKSTYHVTLINPDGTIGYSRDTGVHALSDWGIRPVSMYMEGADVLHIYSWADSHSKILFEGRLNLTTGKYTSIKDFVRPQS